MRKFFSKSLVSDLLSAAVTYAVVYVLTKGALLIAPAVAPMVRTGIIAVSCGVLYFAWAWVTVKATETKAPSAES